MPTRCPVAPEARAIYREIRQLLFGKPPNVHRILLDEVRILSIRHGARSPFDPGELGGRR